MHKFYWNNTQRNRLQSSEVGATDRIEMEAGNGLCQGLYHPQLPARNVASTMIKVEQRDQRATTPSGSHRVLLKLKKISANRPKSMHEADLDEENNIEAQQQTSRNKRLPSSRSTHQFYNRTWNERSLTKYANQHNYENVYSEEDTEHTGHLLISQLTCSPRSARATRIWQENGRSGAPPQPEHEAPPIPPERKGRGRRRGHQENADPYIGHGGREPQRIAKPLFRSKSCERPKMRDTFRMEKFAANLNRISSNITDKIIQAKGSSGNTRNSATIPSSATSPHLAANPVESSHNSCEIMPQNGNSLLQNVAFRAIPCVDIQANNSHHYYHPTVTTEDHNSCDLDNISDLSVRPPTAASNTSSTTSRPSLALAHKMKGLRKDMQEKISRLRSRSAERISKRRSLRRSSPSEERVSQRSDRSASISVEDEYDLPPPYRRMTKSYSGLPTPSVYNGPFIGRARALVDYIPSPYDRDALRFSRGDIIDIISMNPSGLWRGKSQGRVGHFKFINVELLPDRNTLRQQRRSASEKMKEGPPQSVEDLLKRIGLEEHLSVFVLNGYEELENFHDLNEAELDYLGITEPGQRAKIMSAVDLMQDTSTLSTASDDDEDTEKNKTPTKSSTKSESFERHNFPRDSGCFASSSPASDRSSQQSQSESGIHLPHDDDEDADYSDESTSLATSHHTNTQPLKRPADKSAQTRDLRERHVTNTQELEKLQLKDAFEVLVEKYVTDKTPLHVETGRVSNTRSIFENHQI